MTVGSCVAGPPRADVPRRGRALNSAGTFCGDGMSGGMIGPLYNMLIIIKTIAGPPYTVAMVVYRSLPGRVYALCQ